VPSDTIVAENRSIAAPSGAKIDAERFSGIRLLGRAFRLLVSGLLLLGITGVLAIVSVRGTP
jgi:hypothetical protein